MVRTHTGGGGRFATLLVLLCFLGLGALGALGTLRRAFGLLLLRVLSQQLCHHRICIGLVLSPLRLRIPVEVVQGRLRRGEALRGSEPKQPPRLGMV